MITTNSALKALHEHRMRSEASSNHIRPDEVRLDPRVLLQVSKPPRRRKLTELPQWTAVMGLLLGLVIIVMVGWDSFGPSVYTDPTGINFVGESVVGSSIE